MALLTRLQRALPFLLVIVVAGYLWTVADAFDFRPRSDRPGPDLWPRIVLGLMFLASVWGIVQALLKPVDDGELSVLVRLATRSVGREEEAEKELEGEGLAVSRPIFALGGILSLFLFVALIPYIGFTLATFALMSAVMLIGGMANPGKAFLIAFIGTLAFFVIFQKVAYVSLPLGQGPFRDVSIGLMSLLGVR